PIFFMLAEFDQVQLVRSCIKYIERMRKAGRAEIRVAVYPGVHHSYEGTAGLTYAADDWASYDCAGRFERDENFLLYHRGTNKRITTGSQTEFLFKSCLKHDYVVGGDERVKAHAAADLIQFLRMQTCFGIRSHVRRFRTAPPSPTASCDSIALELA